eukprot:CAMPEP_0174703584 /NCGR_PEP_ID=MMETSP1094-20130205/7481_1 /TAXON_ID=156173 /ORGANISM="Chrysochromulina brevifilum, Strain UTEX LB 985" /LENGTH=96 /DNA_ID=CAMNT_0015901527 /DNA_START=277 /DNA_END=567 /DNA_ORIENTATION=+
MAFIRRISPGLGSALPAGLGAVAAGASLAWDWLPGCVSPRLHPPSGTSYPSQDAGSSGSYTEPPLLGGGLPLPPCQAPLPPPPLPPPLPPPFPGRS